MILKENISIKELAVLLVDAILSETHLNKEVLVPKCEALIKTMVGIKIIPKDYNAYVSPSKNAARLRTIELKDEEIRFWKDVVRRFVPKDDMHPIYMECRQNLIDKGYWPITPKQKQSHARNS